MRILRMPEVLATIGYRSHASIYTAISEGLFTKPVRIGQRSVGWPSTEIETILHARIASKSDVEIRALVGQLHLLRTAPLETKE